MVLDVTEREAAILLGAVVFLDDARLTELIDCEAAWWLLGKSPPSRSDLQPLREKLEGLVQPFVVFGKTP